MVDTSPNKRAKVSAAPSTAIAPAMATAVAGEPALLHNIISFIPFSSTDETGPTPFSQPAAALRTIAALCRAFPGLSNLVGPANEAFWRNMVLAHFDFTTSGDTFNVEDWGGDWDVDEEAVDDECDDPEFADWHRHPNNGPHREWSRAQSRKNKAGGKPSANASSDTRDSDDDAKDSDDGESSDKDEESEEEDGEYPDHFLVDGLEYWSALDTYFKPSAYGFLEKIQQDPTHLQALWPDHEDAYTLFQDLLLLPRFQSTEKYDWETWSDGQQVVSPCLMGRFPTKIIGQGFAMLKFCDFAPCFWRGMQNNDEPENPVSDRWSGFDGPLPTIECKWETLREQKKAAREARKRLQDDGGDQSVQTHDIEEEERNDDRQFQLADHEECEDRTDQESSIFPMSNGCSAHPFLHLRRFVYETFSDWRRVHISQCENASPEFYIGSTRRSGRWMGFVGQSDYWA